MKSKAFAVCGAAAPIVYVAAVIIGGFITPGYNHLSMFVSDLIARGAPARPLLDALFGAYNLLVVVFAAWLALGIVSDASGSSTLGAVGSWVLAGEGLVGIVTLFVPEGPAGAPLDLVGTLHIVLAGVSSLATMAAMLLIGLWLRGGANRRGFGTYSFVSVAFVFVSGGLAAALGAQHSPILGLMERLTIGGFLQWLLVIALVAVRSD